jgi:hypothetical protein
MTERIHRILGAEHIQRFRLHSLSLSHPEVKLGTHGQFGASEPSHD